MNTEKVKIIDNNKEEIEKHLGNGFGNYVLISTGIVNLNNNHINALLQGKALVYSDGEYTTVFVLK